MPHVRYEFELEDEAWATGPTGPGGAPTGDEVPDGFGWRRQRGPTPQWNSTGVPSGPKGDGWYWYTETSGMVEGATYGIHYDGSACAGGIVAQVTFQFAMHGLHMGSLHVVVPDGRIVWSEKYDHGIG